MNDSKVKVRFAPSPTGFFTIGNARTALFNWLFSQNQNGEFYLRIEDTDKERSLKKYEDEIIESLKWLDLNWQGEIIRQSERIKIYKQYLEKLLNENKAYYCFCTPDELLLERQAQLSQGLAPKYSGKCRNLSKTEVLKKLEKGERAVIRFKMPDIDVTFNDLIRGKITYNTGLIGDIVIAKSLFEPLYNFAVVIDDYEMGITHVIRGEDHLPNTPKQIMIFKAFDLDPPKYAHLPLILGPDRKKLSKRFLTKSLLDYKKEGYLKEAILNFLVLLGWHPKKDREIISVKEMIEEFSLDRIQKSGAVFNPEKLDWFNAYYLRTLDSEIIYKNLKDFLPNQWYLDKDYLIKIIEIERGRVKKLTDFRNNIDFFFNLPNYPPELLIWKQTEKEKILNNLKEVLKIIENNQDFKKILDLAQEKGRGEVLWPLRVALSGKEFSPDPLEIIQILKKEEIIKRIKIAIDKLKE